MSMKDVKMKRLCATILILLVPVVFFFGNRKESFVSALQGGKNLNSKVDEILKQNEDKELISNEVFQDKFIYLAFQKEEEFTSFFVDVKTGEEKVLFDYIKEDRKEEFTNTVQSLLYLKYPKFIADVLSLEETEKSVQLSTNELVIHYNQNILEPKIEESLYLRVNYNEIKDTLDFPVSLDSEYNNENGYDLDKNKKAVALTFDDGPNGARTNKIVDILEQNKAHATFFMVGNRMESGKETILNVLNKGNEIGSHSYNHKNMKRMKLEDVISEEEQTKEVYYKITGKELLYTRPPYGNITQQIKENLPTIFVNWNMDTEDWLHRNKDHIVQYVMENVTDGDIILMHDSYDSTVEAVEELLPKLYAEGYQVVSISELAQLKGKTLEKNQVYRSIEAN